MRYFFILIVWAASTLSGAAQTIAWANQISSSNSQAGGARISTDSQGNVYCAGTFYDSIQAGNIVAVSASERDFYLAKYNSSGVLIWLKSIGGTGLDFIKAIKSDSAGNCYITGGFSGQVQFDSVSLTADSVDIFVAKLTSNGEVLWAKSFGGSFADYGTDICYNAQGHCFVAATFLGSISVGAFTLSTQTNSGQQICAVKFNEFGQVTWVKQTQSFVWEGGWSGNIAADAQGNVYLSGEHTGLVSIDSVALGENGDFGGRMFLIKFDASGMAAWGKEFHAWMDAYYSSGIGTDNAGNCYLAGAYQDYLAMPTDMVSLNYGEAGQFPFLLKYLPNGQLAFARTSTSVSGAYGEAGLNSMVADSHGNTYLTGWVVGQVNFGGHTLTTTSPTEAPYLACYNTNGDAVWAQRLTSTPHDAHSYAVALAPGNSCYVFGNFEGTAATFGSHTLTNSSQNDIFLLRLGNVTGLSEPEHVLEQELNLFPNPAAEKINLSFSLAQPSTVSYQIITITGQVLQRQSAGVLTQGNQEVQIKVGQLSAGIYFCTLQAGNAVVTCKLVIAR